MAAMAFTEPDPDEDAYNSGEDDDFDPTKAAETNVSSDSESDEDHADTKVSGPKRVKRDSTQEEAGDAGYENSGDEAVIRTARKRKRKHGQDDGDSGGEGGFVKTRRMKAVEGKEKKPLVTAETATIDVDALWKSMNSKPSAPSTPTPPSQATAASTGQVGSPSSKVQSVQPPAESPAKQVSTTTDSEAMITIKRTYVFAGETHTEEKVVPKSSAEAKLYLESQKKPSSTPPDHPPLRRPLKRVSRFEPNPGGVVKGLQTGVTKGQKLNVVEKSKLDWAGYVDKEGIQDELKTAEKAKDGYLSRTDFLKSVEAKREDDLRNARLK